MSDPLDSRIRELFAELDQAAPAVPPRPTVAPAPKPFWQRALAPAAAVGLIALVVGVSAQLLSQQAASEDGATPTTSAAEGAAADGTTRSPDNALVLTNTNAACLALFRDTSILDRPNTPPEYRSALEQMVEPLARLATASAGLATSEEAKRVADLVAQGASGPASLAVAVYSQLKLDLRQLSQSLTAAGAIECEPLIDFLP